MPVRLITEPQQYRDPTRLWDSWNVDRLYMAGMQIRDRAHAGLNHQKSDAPITARASRIFGSSNWTSPSANSQEEHNFFTTKPEIFHWFVRPVRAQVEQHRPASPRTPTFVPLPPDAADHPAPANGASGVGIDGRR